MSWQEITLGTCFTIKHGFAFRGEHFADNGIHVVLTPGNFHEPGGFRARLGKDRYYGVEPPQDFILKPGDLVIAMTEQGEGLLGSSALIPQQGSYLHNQRIGLVENLDTEKMDKIFLYHLFNTPAVRAQIRASASGGKVRHTAPKRIYAIQVRAPDVRDQRTIAAMISAHDDLIDNNRRRIELLEKAARLLYMEWFIYLRFPGHEHARITGGIPEGFELRRLGDVISTNADSYAARELPEVITYVDIASVTRGRIVTRTRMTAAEAPGRARRKASDGDVIWSNVRPNLRAYALVLDPQESDVFSTGFTVLTPRNVPFSWLYFCVTTDSFVGHLVNHATGAGYPAVRPADFADAAVLVPPGRLLDLFHDATEASFRLISKLNVQCEKLTEARDLLLPRLMNGEITV